jgi:hypothetical protein
MNTFRIYFCSSFIGKNLIFPLNRFLFHIKDVYCDSHLHFYDHLMYSRKTIKTKKKVVVILVFKPMQLIILEKTCDYYFTFNSFIYKVLSNKSFEKTSNFVFKWESILFSFLGIEFYNFSFRSLHVINSIRHQDLSRSLL